MATDVAEAKARVFRHGGSQALRLPKAFRVDGAEVTLRRTADGFRVITTKDRVAAFDAAMEELARLRADGSVFDVPERPADDDVLYTPLDCR